MVGTPFLRTINIFLIFFFIISKVYFGTLTKGIKQNKIHIIKKTGQYENGSLLFFHKQYS